MRCRPASSSHDLGSQAQACNPQRTDAGPTAEAASSRDRLAVTEATIRAARRIRIAAVR